MEHEDDVQYFPGIEIGVNEHTDAESLYDEFWIELDSIRGICLLQQLGDFAPGQWVLLDDLCKLLDCLPDHAAEIIACYPGRLAMCHVPWPGKCANNNQPDSMVLVGDAVSMYHRAMLANVETAT